MTTPTGTISMSDVNIELSNASTALVTLNDTNVRTLAGVPSGLISMNNLRGKSSINYGTLTANFTVRSEGQPFTFTLAGGALPGGTYYWRVDYVSNLSSADFSAVTGSFTVTSNTGSFTVTTVNDSLDEGDGTFRVFASDVSGVPVAVVTSPTYTVTETTTYTATASKTSIFRYGGLLTDRNVVHTVSTTQVAVGTWIYTRIISVTGTVTFSGGVNSNDLLVGQESSFQVTGALSAGQAEHSVVAAEYINGATVASKTYRVQYFTDAARTNLVATGPIVTLRAAPTYALSFSPTSVAEGRTSTATITLTDFPSPSVLYYTAAGTASATADWLGGAASGSIGISSSTATFSVTAAYDGTTESSESLTFSLRTASTSGTVVATGTVTITQALGTYSLSISRGTTGATSGAPVSVTGQITGAAAYPLARSFAITYSLNGGARTTTGMTTTTITVAANATSSSSTVLYNTSGPGSVTSLNIQATLTGHNTVTSANISGFFVG